MGEVQFPSEIPAAEWASTPASVQQLVLTLPQMNEELRGRIGKLEERLNQNSQNSSQLPSADGPSKPVRPPKAVSGCRRGGQPGHEGHTRLLKASEEVDFLVDVRPTSCSVCGALLLGDDPCAERRQVTEVPRVASEITEYRRHSLCCLACGAVTTAAPTVGRPTTGSIQNAANSVGRISEVCVAAHLQQNQPSLLPVAPTT